MNPYHKLFPVFGFISGVVFCLLIFVSYSSHTFNAREDSDLPQKVFSISMDKAFDFAGEPLPMNEDTRERLDRELSVNAYWQSSTLLNIKISNKHFPAIVNILKENGIPEDFKYLAVAESGLRNVTSSASAKGYWQFMKAAAEEMDLEINTEVDERFHLEKSTIAACKYLQKLYKKFGTWTNVAAAYNVGPTALAKTFEEQKEDSYYNININDETSRYIFRIVAIKEIVKDPTKYGYYLEDDHKYQPIQGLKAVKLTSSVPSLADLAHQFGTTYRLLKYYNPWLISTKLTISPGKEYIIKVPE